MSSNEVWEISSDEDEPGIHWLSTLLDCGDETEVVVLEGGADDNGNLRPKDLKNSEFKEDLDDDCCVLEDNPNKLGDDAEGGLDSSDDLVITGEKGEVACRDFPHPRHLCVKFPFSSTSHEKFCNMCHCYVCDTHAPCFQWCTWNSACDHCHATEHDEKWKMERKNFKKNEASPATMPKTLDTSLSMAPTHCGSGPAPTSSHSTHFMSNMPQPSQIRLPNSSSPYTPCSTNRSTTPYVLPKFSTKRRTDRAAFVYVGSKTSEELLNKTHTHRERTISTLSNHHKRLKSTFPSNASLMNRASNSSYNNNNQRHAQRLISNHILSRTKAPHVNSTPGFCQSRNLSPQMLHPKEVGVNNTQNFIAGSMPMKSCSYPNGPNSCDLSSIVDFSFLDSIQPPTSPSSCSPQLRSYVRQPPLPQAHGQLQGGPYPSGVPLSSNGFNQAPSNFGYGDQMNMLCQTDVVNQESLPLQNNTQQQHDPNFQDIGTTLSPSGFPLEEWEFPNSPLIENSYPEMAYELPQSPTGTSMLIFDFETNTNEFTNIGLL
ncbi:hypothetical protein AMTRI_Chr07g25300 [Amborella trichopoda]|uniref:Uncharacterized protein n=1 Tax=Amborella trichopoda TaxID=13333 RepID=U5CRS3_AMBTC|nr:uncharacterized protein LOC18444216 [Amborella trichopoda]ERN15921.1 hypothetical protein AMTR_s00039p00226610 [Amborella trichopoda]|eukprot:XP_006854454.1 uncharacterized protein LOC18444216 [Amborella trichopoda]